jgi:hypothetical protein
MSLIVQVRDDVPASVQNQGDLLYRSGAVEIESGSATHVDAIVQDGQWPTNVSLHRTKKTVKVWCSCTPFADSGDPCKHIWAAVLAAADQGCLSKGGTSRLRVVEDESFWDDDAEVWGDDDDYNDDVWEREDEVRPPSIAGPPPAWALSGSKEKSAQNWKQQLTSLKGNLQGLENRRHDQWPAGREILYLVDVPATLNGGGLVIEVAYRERKRNGDWSKPRSQRLTNRQLAELPDPADRQILAYLAGGKADYAYQGYGYGGYYYDSLASRYTLSENLQLGVVPLVAQTGRCFVRPADPTADLQPIRWEEADPWEFWLAITEDPSGKQYRVEGQLRRGDERRDLSAPRLLTAGGLVFWEDHVSRLQDFGVFPWILQLRNHGPLQVPVKQKDQFLKELLGMPRIPRLDLPEALRYEEVHATPKPRLLVRKDKKQYYHVERLVGELSFDYDGEIVPARRAGRTVFQAGRNRLLWRDEAGEKVAAERLRQAGFHASNSYYGRDSDLELAPRNLPRVVRTLLAEGWHIEAEGKVFRRSGTFSIAVTSGIDWFELHGAVRFGDTEAPLPELLAALRKGEDTVRLGDGTFGILPQEWLKKYGLLAGVGTAEDGHLRFSRAQVGLLDALLASQPEATWDDTFNQAREELRKFEGIEPAEAPPGFVGQLRGYQRDGLGWLYFLQKFGFGGCLADDMGLGKTVQVLALLESRRRLRESGAADRPGPSLVVVPKSLVFNWKEEAARFTPQLRVLDHTGIDRARQGESFGDYDLVITTYGTLRRDAFLFKDICFDYCILDEAQAIKNTSSESAKAARLLRADHRLALSGTPVENHLGELWSLFEFLNPGMLGSASVFRLTGAAARNPEPETRALLARALRPFILRRTKEQVARDLPQKLEQTLFCELEPAQRKQYNELRDYYRRTLHERIEREGLNKAKIQVVEALLRLRQAACHPGLLDKKKTAHASAKLDMLLPQLTEVLEEGHKVLVFSQFTQFLGILRQRLDAEGIPYEYLDGKTRNRQERVERFQNDPECKLFLISLKAGGLGLNLTAAEYVFLLDPWWNPAVEAQAIDRTHRIGQTRAVFAYRLIARNTVEEKVLELQKSKRDLADAIINADNSLIRNLGREDLELLLS